MRSISFSVSPSIQNSCDIEPVERKSGSFYQSIDIIVSIIVSQFVIPFLSFSKTCRVTARSLCRPHSFKHHNLVLKDPINELPPHPLALRPMPRPHTIVNPPTHRKIALPTLTFLQTSNLLVAFNSHLMR
jgi:hypothetical protein